MDSVKNSPGVCKGPPEYVYMLRCGDASLYTGCAKDVAARVASHNAGGGAKCLLGKRPVYEVYREACPDRSTALSREAAIKKRSRAEKLSLVLSGLDYPAQLTPSHFAQMEALEKSCYDPAYIAPAEAAYAWYQAYPNSVTASFYRGEIAGFVNLFPVTGAVFSAILEGEFDDSALSPAHIFDPASPGPVYLFFSCIAISPAFRGLGLAGALLNRSLARYEPFRDRVQAVVCDNVTAAGERLSQRLGMERIGPSRHGTAIYRGSYASFYENAHLLCAPKARRDGA